MFLNIILRSFQHPRVELMSFVSGALQHLRASSSVTTVIRSTTRTLRRETMAESGSSATSARSGFILIVKSLTVRAQFRGRRSRASLMTSSINARLAKEGRSRSQVKLKSHPSNHLRLTKYPMHPPCGSRRSSLYRSSLVRPALVVRGSTLI